MGAVTYPNDRVVEFIMGHMVTVEVLFNAEPLATNFNVRWTPTVITLDEEGKSIIKRSARPKWSCLFYFIAGPYSRRKLLRTRL
jgi:hypothetical protein